MKTINNNRGLSYTIEYALTVAILIAVFTILTTTFSSGLTETERNTAEYESERVASDIIGNVNEIDSAVQNMKNDRKTTDFNITTQVKIPSHIAGGDYQITTTERDGTQYLQINHPRFRQPYEVVMETETEIRFNQAVTGSGMVITYDHNTDTIEVSST